MSNIRQRIACKGLIVHESKILILREASTTYKDGTNPNKYHVPGGRIEPGEYFMDGLLREIKEETGLEVTVGKPLYVGEWRPIIRGEENQIVAVFFVCQAESDKVVLSEEHDDFQWINPGDHGAFQLMDPDVEVIQAYMAEYPVR
jgi:8-oxo-dGTP diphosphatase